MNIRYLYKDIKIDDRTREYVEKRLEKLEKILDKITLCEVEIGLEKNNLFRVEVMVQVPGKIYRSEETTESVEGSIDEVVDEIQSQIRKDKEKTKVIKERGGRSIKKKIAIDKMARF